MKKKTEYQTYKCPNNHKFKIVYTGWYPSKPCPKCGESAFIFNKDEQASSFSIKTKEDITGFYRTKTGQLVALNKHGRITENHRYNLNTDPHGWKAIGRKVRETDRKGRRNI